VKHGQDKVKQILHNIIASFFFRGAWSALQQRLKRTKTRKQFTFGFWLLTFRTIQPVDPLPCWALLCFNIYIRTAALLHPRRCQRHHPHSHPGDRDAAAVPASSPADALEEIWEGIIFHYITIVNASETIFGIRHMYMVYFICNIYNINKLK